MTPPQPVAGVPGAVQQECGGSKDTAAEVKERNILVGGALLPARRNVLPVGEIVDRRVQLTKLNTLRRFSGNSVTCLVEISAPMLALSVCSRGAAAVTSICSVDPMVKCTLDLRIGRPPV